MRALVAGWFSFEGMGATAGDLMARDLAREWLVEAGREVHVAHAPPFEGGVDWCEVDPAAYSELVFVCGPIGNGEPVTGLLERFAGRRVIGLDLTMLEPLEAWNPFDLLLERDSSATSRPDISFASRQPLVPVVGLVLIHRQPEYGDRDVQVQANAALQRLVDSRELAAVRIDTRLDENATGLRTPAEIESLIARMDVVLTTRLHGLVLALKNGVPAVAIDPVAGGSKVTRQAETIGWPLVFGAEASDDELAAALDYGLTEEARGEARACAERARGRVEEVRQALISALST
jgi:hypothetical protein